MMPLIAVVDDDISVRESLDSLLRSAGLKVRVFASAEEFLNSDHHCDVNCLILDVQLPGMSGFELQRELLAGSCRVPVVFVTAHGYDKRTMSEAASDWTVAYLTKPFSEAELLEAINTSLRWKPNGRSETTVKPRRSHE
jgi:FixJ family two-component response regulator